MTVYQWAYWGIFIVLLYYANKNPKKTDIYLPQYAGDFYTGLYAIPLRIFSCVYSIWYCFSQIPVLWGALNSQVCTSILSLLLVLFYFFCILVIPTVTIGNTILSLVHLRSVWRDFWHCYKNTQELFKNGFFSSSYHRRIYGMADVKYISLKTVLKIKDVTSFYIGSETCVFFYRTHNHKEIFLSCSPVTYLVILLSVVKQKEKEQKEKDKLNSKEKKKKAVRDDSELLEIFIEDLQKRKEENERKASQYFEKAKETFEQVKNNS